MRPSAILQKQRFKCMSYDCHQNTFTGQHIGELCKALIKVTLGKDDESKSRFNVICSIKRCKGETFPLDVARVV